MSINERVIFACISLVENGYARSLTEIAKKCGKSGQFFTDVKSGKSSVPLSFIATLVSNYPANNDYITTGEGEPLKSKDNNSNVPKIRYWTDVEATAGGVTLFDDLITNNYIEISIPEFRDCTDAVNLYGDSMTPLYKSGQIIIMKRWQESFIDFGSVYLIITKNGNRMVKYIRKGCDNGHIICASENPAFDPFEIELSDVLALYLVKGGISKNTL